MLEFTSYTPNQTLKIVKVVLNKSIFLQVICFVFVLKPDLFGITDASFPARLSFLLVGIWWVSFAYIPFTVLPKSSPNYNKLLKTKVASGYDELRKVWNQLKQMPVLKTFLLAFSLQQST